MISYLLPTRNRPELLRQTLEAIGRLPSREHAAAGGGEVIVVDNASVPPVEPAPRLVNGLPVRTIRLEANAGAAARNEGARAARGQWLVMLDDDSHPLDAGHVAALGDLPDDVAAVGADIRLPDGRREAGGLPEVFIGCGAAIRRDAFLEARGYDSDFGFYAEEYDLCAMLLMAGRRVVHDPRFRVLHRKTAGGRDMDLILGNLVRNNGWVVQRYAPRHARRSELREVITRYARIALKEHAAAGYARGLDELRRTLPRQPRREMTEALFDRFTGRTHAREHLAGCGLIGPGVRAAVVEEGKHARIVLEVLTELGAALVDDERDADVLVIGTLSPGPMLDALERRRAGREAVCPWETGHSASIWESSISRQDIGE